ncbi:unnamed protein product [Gongylonema pulchrum]|uniref:F5/8 type C domain-containing protein n=1 Tax=Gongylonema pulchrum TaxID=637853 RepID=A0A183E520_9BILA|nr:unnamed protein product [Gongylonema pulchrum]
MNLHGALDDHPDSYWLTVDLLSVDWRKGCLTTAGCAEPRFQITELNTVNNEANSISWPVTLKMAEVKTLSSSITRGIGAGNRWAWNNYSKCG